MFSNKKLRRAGMENNLNMKLRDLLPLMQERIVSETSYFGVKALQSPVDFWIYQELVYELRPDVILEIGNRFGGSTLALAHLCDLIGSGRVIGVDISHADIAPQVAEHPRITLIESDACAAFDQVCTLIEPEQEVLIIEDSAHTYEHTLAVLNRYQELVRPGGYFVVEDGICHHGLSLGPRPGPFEAVETFLSRNNNFVADRDREGFFITWNPKGYLRRLF